MSTPKTSGTTKVDGLHLNSKQLKQILFLLSLLIYCYIEVIPLGNNCCDTEFLPHLDET